MAPSSPSSAGLTVYALFYRFGDATGGRSSSFLVGDSYRHDAPGLPSGCVAQAPRAALCLADVSDPVVKIVAEKIIELAQVGECDPNRLCERTLSFFREQHGSDYRPDASGGRS